MSASVTPSLLPSSSPNLESRLASRIQLTSDGFKVYVNAAIEAVADDIDYAQLVKYYGNEPEGQKRYSPATHKGAEKIIRLGDPDPRHVGTIYVERHNLSVVCRYKLSITKKGHTGVEMFQGLFSFLPLAPKPYHAAQANLALPNRASLKDITAQTTRSLLSTLYVKVLSSKVAHYRRQLGLRTDPALLPLSNGRSLHFPAGKAGSVLRGTFGMMLREAPNGQTIPREASFTSMCIPFFAFASSAWLGRAWGPRGAPPPSCARPINQENLAIDLYAPSPRARRHPACTCSSSTPTELKGAVRLEFRGSLLPASATAPAPRVRTMTRHLQIDFCAMGERAALVCPARCEQTHPTGGFTGEAEYDSDLGLGRQTVWEKGNMFPALLLAAKTYTLPPDKLAKAIEYAAARNRLHFIAVAYGILVLLALLAGRVAPRIRDIAESATRRRILQAYIFAPSLLLVIDALDLPIGLYSHHLAVQFEQSIQGWGSWFWDWTKGELLTFALAGIAIWVLYGAMRRSPRHWWFYFWLAAVPMVVFLMFIEPVAIEPLFFKFEPLADRQPALVAAIEKVVARGGLEIPPDRMFEMQASEKLKSLNAYVTGIGASKRVVVWDNTIQKMNTGQTLFVFGHEMGHYVLGHVWIGIGAALFGILIFLFLAFHAMRWALQRWGPRWAIRELRDWASLPVLLLALAIFGFLSEPVSSSFSRVLEHNADIYGLEVIHGIVPNSSEEAANAFQILGEVALDDPNPSPFIEFWLYDHPSISERVRFASQYDPWTTGQAPKYVR